MRHGFTLIELSIVLVIIGLIVAGVTAGSSLIESANIQKTVSDINGYVTSINAFKLKYDAVPGDFNEATDYWSGTVDGDGDNLIESAGGCSVVEAMRAWQHMSLAGVIQTTHDGTALPEGPFDHVYGFYELNTRHFTFLNENALEIGLYRSDICRGALGFITPAVAKNIDKKLDDGVAFTGRMIAMNGDDSGGTSCSAPFSSNPGADYNEASQDVNCRVYYSLDR